MDNGTSADERRLSGETGDGIGIKNIKERVATLMKKKGTGHENSNNR